MEADEQRAAAPEEEPNAEQAETGTANPELAETAAEIKRVMLEMVNDLLTEDQKQIDTLFLSSYDNAALIGLVMNGREVLLTTPAGALRNLSGMMRQVAIMCPEAAKEFIAPTLAVVAEGNPPVERAGRTRKPGKGRIDLKH